MATTEPVSTQELELARGGEPPEHDPYVPDDVHMHEFTWNAVLLGAVLGIIFGASSLYLVLKVGMTVSASIPVAVLSVTLFRLFSRMFGLRRATILENNIVQTTGSAGESIAFGVGVTIPALLLLGFEMEITRVMTVGVLGGLLGILMMIPLRRAFIVAQHGKLKYPEGTACAEVLIAGEQGGATAKTVFAGFGLAFVYKFAMNAMHLWKEAPTRPLYSKSGQGLVGGELGGELSPELLGVGYIIGPRIASITFAGGVLAYLVLAPMIVLFGEGMTTPLAPATVPISAMKDEAGRYNVGQIRNEYILYIGAGAVATGGIISMIQAMPLILASIRAGLRDISGRGDAAGHAHRQRRTEQDLSLGVVVAGCVGMVLAMMAVPGLGLGFTFNGLVGAVLIVFFGFLFVTVSSRLTGEIGSSSNPISGMTVATLLFTCLIFVMLGQTNKAATLTALTVAAIVCIASSNGGTTSQDLKTGYLIGGTPRLQQLAILVGALTSALVIGVTLLLLNEAGTVYSKQHEIPADFVVPNFESLTDMQQVGGEYADKDQTLYHVLHLAQGEMSYPADGRQITIPQGKYLVDDQGHIQYLVDPAINGRLSQRDDGTPVANKFEAPKTRLMAIIIDGIMNQKLPWGLVLIGALIAVTLQLAGVPSLPFAVGVYLPIQTTVPIFIGGLLRWTIDHLRRTTEAEADRSPGVLLSTGYIAGGSIGGVLIAFLSFAPAWFNKSLRVGARLPEAWQASDWPAVVAFGTLVFVLGLVGMEKLLRSSEAVEKR
jgi:putative OPT family oligopeptide transporter